MEEKFETGGKSTEQEVIDSLRQVGVAACGCRWLLQPALGTSAETNLEG